MACYGCGARCHQMAPRRRPWPCDEGRRAEVDRARGQTESCSTTLVGLREGRQRMALVLPAVRWRRGVPAEEQQQVDEQHRGSPRRDKSGVSTKMACRDSPNAAGPPGAPACPQTGSRRLHALTCSSARARGAHQHQHQLPQHQIGYWLATDARWRLARQQASSP